MDVPALGWHRVGAKTGDPSSTQALGWGPELRLPPSALVAPTSSPLKAFLTVYLYYLETLPCLLPPLDIVGGSLWPCSRLVISRAQLRTKYY